MSAPAQDASVIALARAAMAINARYAHCMARVDNLEHAGVPISEALGVELEVVAEAWAEARNAVFSAQPETVYGIRAIFEFLKSDPYADQDEFELLIASLLACPALALDYPTENSL